MKVEAEAILNAYLRELEHGLVGLEASDRAEIVLEMREHFEEARRQLAKPTEADLRNVLERLGPPSEIAQEAHQRLGTSKPTSARGLPPSLPTSPPAPHVVERAHVRALEVVGLLMWIVWWPAGAVITGLSGRWSLRDKAVAILTGLVLLALFVSFDFTPLFQRSAGWFWLGVGLWLHQPTLSGIVGAGYLSWRLAYPAGYGWSPAWKVVGRSAGVLVGAWLLWSLLLGPSLSFIFRTTT